jgi:hypothetical protein
MDKADILDGVLIFSFDELIKYFEVLTIVLINQNQSKSYINNHILYLNNLKWNESCNLFPLTYNLTEKCLESPHAVFEIRKSNQINKIGLVKIAFNLIIDSFEKSDFFTFFILPVCFIVDLLFN